MKLLFCAIALIVLLASSASAGCWFKDKLYPTGTTIGDMICGDDGYWQPKTNLINQDIDP